LRSIFGFCRHDDQFQYSKLNSNSAFAYQCRQSMSNTSCDTSGGQMENAHVCSGPSLTPLERELKFFSATRCRKVLPDCPTAFSSSALPKHPCGFSA
jgi:hypothetical protein